MPLPWFRLYSEALSDRKLGYIARDVGQPKYAIIGAWACILCLANESPERGALMLTHDKALSDQDIAREMGMPTELCQQLLSAFAEYKLITRNADRWVVTRWHTRQFRSDNSTELVRQWRERKRMEEKEEEETPEDANMPQYCDNIPEIYCSESLSLSESESKTINNMPKLDPKLPIHLQPNTVPRTILIFRQLLRHSPAPGTPRWNAIAQLPQDDESVEKWRMVVAEWDRRGYKHGNVRGMLDWFHDGIPPSGAPWQVKEKMESQADEQEAKEKLKRDLEIWQQRQQAEAT